MDHYSWKVKYLYLVIPVFFLLNVKKNLFAQGKLFLNLQLTSYDFKSEVL